jgi:hypothetical protein
LDKNSIISEAAHSYQTQRAGVLTTIGRWLTTIDPDVVLSTSLKAALVVTAAGAAANIAGTACMDEVAISMGLKNWVASLPQGVGYLWTKGPFGIGPNAVDMNLTAGLEHLGELPAYGVAKVLGAYAFIGALPAIVATSGIAGAINAIRCLGTAPTADDQKQVDNSLSRSRL